MTPRTETSTWSASRRRAEYLRAHHAFAAEPLTLYLALLDVWEKAEAAARSEQPTDLASWAAERILPEVLATTAESGPRPLAEALLPLTAAGWVAPDEGLRSLSERPPVGWVESDRGVRPPVERAVEEEGLRLLGERVREVGPRSPVGRVVSEAGPRSAGEGPLVEGVVPAAGSRLGAGARSAVGGAAVELLAAWLAGVDLVPVERYLARATLCGPLAAVDVGGACAADPAVRGGRRCPVCGGVPQFAVRSGTGDRLVSGRRMLRCSRCAASWRFSSSACASCGESAQRTVHSEQTVLPHLRVESCAGCRKYLVEVDLGREPAAVPEVDELVAMPLDLHATEQGFDKITPNLMGF